MSEYKAKTYDKEIEKLHAETSKLIAESAKLNKDMKWYEAVLVSATTLAILAIVKHFL